MSDETIAARTRLTTPVPRTDPRDPRTASALRRLAEGFQYQRLLDLSMPALVS